MHDSFVMNLRADEQSATLTRKNSITDVQSSAVSLTEKSIHTLRSMQPSCEVLEPAPMKSNVDAEAETKMPGQKQLQSMLKREIKERKRVRIHSKGQYKLSQEDRQAFLKRNLIAAPAKKMKLEENRKRISRVLQKVSESFCLENTIDQDVALKKSLMIVVNKIVKQEVQQALKLRSAGEE